MSQWPNSRTVLVEHSEEHLGTLVLENFSVIIAKICGRNVGGSLPGVRLVDSCYNHLGL